MLTSISCIIIAYDNYDNCDILYIPMKKFNLWVFLSATQQPTPSLFQVVKPWYYIYILHCLLYAPHHQYCSTTIIIIAIRKATSGCQSGKPPWANWNWNERVSLLFLDSGASVQDRSPLGLDFYHYCYLYCPKSLDTYLPKLADTSWRRRRAARKGSRGWSRAAAASIITGIFVWNLQQQQNLTLLDIPARLIIRLLFGYAFEYLTNWRTHSKFCAPNTQGGWIEEKTVEKKLVSQGMQFIAIPSDPKT